MNNTIETPIVPERPKVLSKQEATIYVPIANYDTPGIASFDSDHFIITNNGKVKFKRNLTARVVSNFEINEKTGELIITYDDGTISTLSIPVITAEGYTRTNLLTSITVNENSFVRDDTSDTFYAAFPSKITGFTNSSYIVSFEELGVNSQTSGYYTINDTLFKGHDGSLLISIDGEDNVENFNGRLLLLGGAIFTDTQIVSINYDNVKNEIVATKTDGTLLHLEAVNKPYVDNTIKSYLTKVYTPKGSISFENLPETPNSTLLGNVWNITNDFVTDYRFIEGYGSKFKAGTNVTVIEKDSLYYYDVLGSFIDLSNFYTKDECNNIHQTIDVITSQDDGFDILYSSGAEVTLPLQGTNGVNVDVSEDGTVIQLKLDEEVAGTKEILIDVPETAIEGTLTTEQLQTLLANDGNYILLANERYTLSDKQDAKGYRIYSHLGFDNVSEYFTKYISIILTNSTWSLTTQPLNDFDLSDTKIKEIVAETYLVGETAPTTETVAQFVGQLYVDTTGNGTYQCTAITTDESTGVKSYTWVKLIRSTDYADENNSGVIDVATNTALPIHITVNNKGKHYLQLGNNNDRIANKNDTNAIRNCDLEYATEVGLTTNTRTLTDDQQTSACDWLGAVKKTYVDNLPDNLTLTEDTYFESGEVDEGTRAKWQHWLGLGIIIGKLEQEIGTVGGFYPIIPDTWNFAEVPVIPKLGVLYYDLMGGRFLRWVGKAFIEYTSVGGTPSINSIANFPDNAALDEALNEEAKAKWQNWLGIGDINTALQKANLALDAILGV